jgi:hypothetical protein
MALAANALTTLATVQSDLGISTDVTDLINAASDAIDRYCGRTFAKGTVTDEAVAGFGTPYLAVARPPIDTDEDVTIEFDGSSVSTSDYETHDASAGLIYCKYTPWTWTASNMPGAEWRGVGGTERKLYAVTYVGGYATPAQVADETYETRTLPYDLEMACRQLVALFYRGLGANPAVQSESLMSASVTYFDASRWPPSVRAILDSYRLDA